MDAADVFLQRFQEIEFHLRNLVEIDDTADFRAVLAAAIERSPEARRYQHDLRQFAMLRNAIVHRPRMGNRPIADPRPDVVERIVAIRDAILEPPSLVSVLHPGVTVAAVDMPIGEAAKRMLDGAYSQLPVLVDGRVVDVLTSEALSRYLTAVLLRDGRADLDAPVGEVAPYDADRTYELVDASATVLAALELFERHDRAGTILHAVIVVKRQPGPLIAIATNYDLPALFAAAAPYAWSS